MLGHPFIAEVKVNHRRVYPCILAKMCTAAMETWLVKTRLKNGFVHFKEIQMIVSFFFHHLLTTNSHGIPTVNNVPEKKKSFDRDGFDRSP